MPIKEAEENEEVLKMIYHKAKTILHDEEQGVQVYKDLKSTGLLNALELPVLTKIIMDENDHIKQLSKWISEIKEKLKKLGWLMNNA